MAYKNILLPLFNYPVRTPDSVISAALEIAKMFGSSVTAAICKANLPNASELSAVILTDVSAVIAASKHDSDAAERELEDALSSGSKKLNLQIRSLTFPGFIDAQSSGLMGHARLSDLIFVPTSRDRAFHNLTHDLIFSSGRPVLVLPANVASELSLAVVVVAWDGSRVAARAISDALPFLKFAKTIRLVEISGDKPLNGASDITALRDQLMSHDVEAMTDVIASEGKPVGDVLTSYCSRHHADLLVMGAYGHSRFRDFILGGATKQFVANTTLPVLLSH